MTPIPTLDTEIKTLRTQINEETHHTSRREYVNTVKPMKDQLNTLIVDNEAIIAANKLEIANRPPTAEEVEAKRKESIAAGIGQKYTTAEQLSMLLKLQTGDSAQSDADIIEWIDHVNLIESEHPKV